MTENFKNKTCMKKQTQETEGEDKGKKGNMEGRKTNIRQRK